MISERTLLNSAYSRYSLPRMSLLTLIGKLCLITPRQNEISTIDLKYNLLSQSKSRSIRKGSQMSIKQSARAAFVRLATRREAQGYTEYVVLVALIAIAAYAAVQLMGTNVS